MASADASVLTPADEQAIRVVVRDYRASWNRHDIAAMADLFAEEAQWVNIVGWYWPTKRAVVAGHEAIHRSFFQATDIELAEVDIRSIAPGVAVAVVLLKVGPFTPPDGIPRPESEDRLSFILTQQAGKWRIAHGHNTVIDPAAQRFDPIISE